MMMPGGNRVPVLRRRSPHALQENADLSPHRFSEAWECAREVTAGRITAITSAVVDGQPALLVYTRSGEGPQVTWSPVAPWASRPPALPPRSPADLDQGVPGAATPRNTRAGWAVGVTVGLGLALSPTSPFTELTSRTP